MYQRSMVFFVMLYPIVSMADDTQLNLYRPFAESSKHEPVSIIETIKGDCMQQSERTQREDAWRCVSRVGHVYDPCFSKRFDTEARVVCPQSPWSGRSIEIMLDKPLDESDQKLLDMSRNLPWAIQLADGERCISVASNTIYDGVQVQYRCSQSTVLLGDAHRCSPTWSILKHDKTGTSVADIAVVWF
jgi:hypothetical protein